MPYRARQHARIQTEHAEVGSDGKEGRGQEVGKVGNIKSNERGKMNEQNQRGACFVVMVCHILRSRIDSTL